MSTDGNDNRIALVYDGELVAYCKVWRLVGAAAEGLSEPAQRARDEVVNTARGFGAGVI